MDDADVGAESDLQPTAEGVSVDGGDHRYRQLLPHPGDLLAEMGDAARLDRSRIPALGATVELAEHRQVETGAERLALPREHDDAQLGRGLQLFTGVGDRLEHLPVEGVALVGTVEPDVGDAVDDLDDHSITHPAIVVGHTRLSDDRGRRGPVARGGSRRRDSRSGRAA